MLEKNVTSWIDFEVFLFSSYFHTLKQQSQKISRAYFASQSFILFAF